MEREGGRMLPTLRPGTGLPTPQVGGAEKTRLPAVPAASAPNVSPWR